MESIQKHHIKPFLSILLASNHGSESPQQIHSAIANIIRNESRNGQEITIFETKSDDSGEALIYYTPYQILKSPTWLKGIVVNDIENHIFISIVLNKTFAIYISEKGMKDEIREHFFSTQLPNIKTIEINQLNFLFINEDKIKMLWLLGIHGKNSFKADSKVLGGKSVAESLDPLEDQSYTMSAVRTEIGDTGKTIGVNPYKSSLWRGPCKDWDSFENRVIEILDKIDKNKDKLDYPISILATPVSEMNNVHTPYDLTFVDYEHYTNDISEHKIDFLKKISNEYSFKINDTLRTHILSLDVSKENTYIGELKIEPKIHNYKIEFQLIESLEQRGKKSELNFFARIFKSPELIKCWYESGHAIVNSKIFETKYRDVVYNDFSWADFENYDITKEKPEINDLVALNEIGKQKSLFCWVKNCWSGAWSNKDNFNTSERSNLNGWLYCDDGAGEKADFIHIGNYNENIYISLIHVKAALSNSQGRRISVGAHDIVINQGIKNLRYTNRKTLLTDLKDRAKKSQIKYCWENGKNKTHDEFTSYLESIENESNTKFRVIVIQPHTMKNYYNNNLTSNIRKQLDVLLISAESAIKASGAEFFIIGFNDESH